MRSATLLAVLAFALAACGQTRRYGDDGGQPVAFSVHLERPFVKAMRNNQWRPSVGAGAAFSSGGYSAVGTGVGLSFSATEVYLLGGDGPAEAQIFTRELKWGDNSFTVPLTPGRKLHLTAKAEGGREGWESLGEITVPRASDARVSITLDAKGPKVVVTPVETAPEKKPEASSQKPEATSPKPEASPQPAASEPIVPDQPEGVERTADAPPPGEHPDAGAKPPHDDTPPVKIEPGPPPGAPPLAAPNATPATPSAPTGPDAP